MRNLASALLAFLLALVAESAGAERRERGKYLVEALMACDNCHTPRGPAGYDEAARFSGGSQSFSGPGYKTRGGNITPDLESGIGGWSDAELRAAIVGGLGRDGPLAPFMPSESYAVLTESDLEAIIAFLRASPPAATPNASPRPRIEEARRPSLPGAEAPFAPERLDDRASRGLYVASLARCMACHSGETGDIPDHMNRLGAGGKAFRTPAGVAVASNITSHPEKGVGAWTDDELKRAITRGVSRDGRALKPTMANLSKAHFAKMSAEDLDALVAYIRAIPPKE
jgi:mono/diheme cytochrome c family protein